jgi:hypothetical protein
MYNRLHQFSSSDNMSRLIQIFIVHLQFVYCNVSGETDSFQIFISIFEFNFCITFTKFDDSYMD